VQVDPMKPMLKPPGSKRLNLKCDTLLSTSAFNLNLRRYIERTQYSHYKVERCKSTVPKPVLKAPSCTTVSALQAQI